MHAKLVSTGAYVPEIKVTNDVVPLSTRATAHELGQIVADCGLSVGNAAVEVGEMWILGPHVSLGYWNNLEVTRSVR